MSKSNSGTGGKVLFLGFAHSGKTVLMGVLSRYFENAGDGKFGLNPKNDSSNVFMRVIPATLAKGTWPAQTTTVSLESFQWELLHGREVIASIEMLDYPGEVFRVLFDEKATQEETEEHKGDASRLAQAIAGSNNIFLLVNLDDIEELTTDVGKARASWQLCNAIDYIQALPSHPKFTIVLSQADRYFSDVEAADARQALFNSDSLFCKHINDDLDVIAVSAVGKTVTDNEGNEVPDLTHSHPQGFVPFVRRILSESIIDQRLIQIEHDVEASLRFIKGFPRQETSDTYIKLLHNLEPLSKALALTIISYGFMIEAGLQQKIAMLRAELPQMVSELKTLRDSALSREAEIRRRQAAERETRRREKERQERLKREAEEKARREAEEKQALEDAFAELSKHVTVLRSHLRRMAVPKPLESFTDYNKTLQNIRTTVSNKLKNPALLPLQSEALTADNRILTALSAIKDADVLLSELRTFVPQLESFKEKPLKIRAKGKEVEVLKQQVIRPALLSTIDAISNDAQEKRTAIGCLALFVTFVVILVIACSWWLSYEKRRMVEQAYHQRKEQATTTTEMYALATWLRENNRNEDAHKWEQKANALEKEDIWQREYNNRSAYATSAEEMEALADWLKENDKTGLADYWRENATNKRKAMQLAEEERQRKAVEVERRWQEEYRQRASKATTSQAMEELAYWLYGYNPTLAEEWMEKSIAQKETEWQAEYQKRLSLGHTIDMLEAIAKWADETQHPTEAQELRLQINKLKQLEWERKYKQYAEKVTSIDQIEELIIWLKKTDHADLVPEWNAKRELLKETEWQAEYQKRQASVTTSDSLYALVKWLNETKHVELIPPWQFKADVAAYNEGKLQMDSLSTTRLIAVYTNVKSPNVKLLNKLGERYHRGSQDTAKNYEKARQFYQLAIDAGSSSAISNYGMTYWDTEQYDVALPYFQKAEAQGHSIATYMIGRAYETGILKIKPSFFNGILGDLDNSLILGYQEAIKYFTLAGERGYEPGFHRAEKLKKALEALKSNGVEM